MSIHDQFQRRSQTLHQVYGLSWRALFSLPRVAIATIRLAVNTVLAISPPLFQLPHPLTIFLSSSIVNDPTGSTHSTRILSCLIYPSTTKLTRFSSPTLVNASPVSTVQQTCRQSNVLSSAMVQWESE